MVSIPIVLYFIYQVIGVAAVFGCASRDRADHHLTEISYIYTFFAHVMHPCTITMLCIHGQGYVVSHTYTYRTTDDETRCVPRPHPGTPGCATMVVGQWIMQRLASLTAPIVKKLQEVREHGAVANDRGCRFAA